MSLLRMLEEAQGGQGLAQLAHQFGLDESQARNLAEMFAPTIGKAARTRAERGELATVLSPLKGEAQSAFFDDAVRAAQPDARAQGGQFLDQILGSRDATERMARTGAERSGLDLGAVERFLPALAAMLQGGMQKRTPDAGIEEMLGDRGRASMGGAGGGLMGMIMGMLGGGPRAGGGQRQGGGMDVGSLLRMLDADGDGSPLDDILEQFVRR